MCGCRAMFEPFGQVRATLSKVHGRSNFATQETQEPDLLAGLESVALLPPQS